MILARKTGEKEHKTGLIAHDEPVADGIIRESGDSEEARRLNAAESATPFIPAAASSVRVEADHSKSPAPQAATLPSLTLAKPRSVIQRKAHGEESGAPASKAASSATSSAAASRGIKELPVAKEITDHLPRQERASVVWRKSEGGKSSRPDLFGVLGGAPLAVARQPEAASAPRIIPSEAPPAQEPQQNGQSFEDDSEQIIRMLYRRLAVERERRGID